ncbi:MAG: metal-dependent transcriptional regulator [Lachnospiraceae bacterium]|nr:metal-dependent transcriptional regulator [Lachnospiraceae bacterium]
MNESAEDYIKTIYILKCRNGSVRSVDVAHELGFSRASVCAAMSNLRSKNMIRMDESGEISFTEEGLKTAEDLFDRFTTLCFFLQTVAGVDDQTAKEDACRIEHHISDRTYAGIRRYLGMFSGPNRDGK